MPPQLPLGWPGPGCARAREERLESSHLHSLRAAGGASDPGNRETCAQAQRSADQNLRNRRDSQRLHRPGLQALALVSHGAHDGADVGVHAAAQPGHWEHPGRRGGSHGQRRRPFPDGRPGLCVYHVALRRLCGVHLPARNRCDRTQAAESDFRGSGGHPLRRPDRPALPAKRERPERAEGADLRSFRRHRLRCRAACQVLRRRSHRGVQHSEPGMGSSVGRRVR